MDSRRLLVPNALTACSMAAVLVVGHASASAQNGFGGGGFAAPSVATILSGTPQHALLSAGTAGEVSGITMPWLALKQNRQAYPHPEITQTAFARDPAIEAAFASPDYGAQLLATAPRTIATIGIPAAPGQFGSFSMLNAPFLRPKVAARRKGRLRPGGVPQPPAAAVPARAAPAPISAAGLVRQVRVTPAQRLANARRVMIHHLTAWVTLDRDGSGATLHVAGSLPPAVNSNTPVNLTVEASQYDSSSNNGNGLQTPSAAVLLDKQLLPPAVEGGEQYFYASYPLAPPPPGAQTNLLIRYWGDPGVALTQAIALARTPNRPASNPQSWVAIPASRLQLYRLPIEYLVINRAQPGDALNYNQTLRQLGIAYGQPKAERKKKPGA